jgi:hypothetical protein
MGAYSNGSQNNGLPSILKNDPNYDGIALLTH